MLACGMLAGCLGLNATSERASAATVQIAAEGPFTGDQASIGMGALQAIKLAVDDFNRSARGVRVQLVIWDDHHDPNVAATQQGQGLADASLLGIVGPMNAEVIAASAARLQSAQPPLPFVTESVGDATLGEGSPAVAHRVSAANQKQAALAAKFMLAQGARRVEVIDSGTDYSKPMADAAESAFKAQAATERSTVKRGGKDFKAIVAKLKAFQADWVFLADEGPEAVVLAQQLSQAGVKIGQNVQLLATEQVSDVRYLRAAGGALDGTYLSQRTADAQSLSSAASFVTAFKSKYGSDSIAAAGPFYGSAYAASQVLLQAIKTSPLRDGKIARKDVLGHLANDTFTTIFGPIRFDSRGDPVKTVITISRALGDTSAPLTAVQE